MHGRAIFQELNRCGLMIAIAFLAIAGALRSSRVNAAEPKPCVTSNDVVHAADDREQSGPPPLVVDKDAPLLLEELHDVNEPSKQPQPQTAADNSACFVCHANYRQELIASLHAANGVGCADCHGNSFAHRNDENNTVPPETLYPPGAINPACEKCHATHDVPAAEVVAKWLERVPAGPQPKTIVCTDCHGDHRLKHRTVRWNKQTKELIPPGAGI